MYFKYAVGFLIPFAELRCILNGIY